MERIKTPIALAIMLALLCALLCGCGAAAQSGAIQPVPAAPDPTPVSRIATRVITDDGVILLESGAAALTQPSPAETPDPALAREALPETSVPADPAPAETDAPELPNEPALEQTPEPTADPAAAERIQAAKNCIGGTTAALYTAIGYPMTSDYASSCLGSGQDGNLYYDGFTVYTYRENGVETVRYVE